MLSVNSRAHALHAFVNGVHTGKSPTFFHILYLIIDFVSICDTIYESDISASICAMYCFNYVSFHIFIF